MTADEVVRHLDLRPHPEGGWYRETFPRGQKSHWHRVDAVEAWHWHDGAPLALSICGGDASPARLILGRDLGAGQLPQAVVPQGWWQAAESLGDWSLVSCTVVPGFEFAGFEMAEPDWEPSAARP
jgi:predicted cupin superfamily sugar epimerase